MMSSLPLSTGSGLAEAVSKPEMEKLLECPVCTEILVPPIYICETGHSICKDCKPKLTECVFCKKLYTNSRNFALEDMIQAEKFHCKQYPKGCTVTGTPEELNTHYRICKFSPVKCFLNGKDDCHGAVLYMSDYMDHLKNVHALRSLSQGKDKQNTFTTNFIYNDWDESKERTKFISTNSLTHSRDRSWWPPRLIYYDGKWFLTRLKFPSGPMLFINFMLIGDEIEAANYAVNITIQNKTNPKKIPRFSLTTTVEPLRAFTENTDKLPLTVIHKDLMVGVGTLTSHGTEKKTNMTWTVNYEITKL